MARPEVRRRWGASEWIRYAAPPYSHHPGRVGSRGSISPAQLDPTAQEHSDGDCRPALPVSQTGPRVAPRTVLQTRYRLVSGHLRRKTLASGRCAAPTRSPGSGAARMHPPNAEPMSAAISRAGRGGRPARPLPLPTPSLSALTTSPAAAGQRRTGEQGMNGGRGKTGQYRGNTTVHASGRAAVSRPPSQWLASQ